MNEAENVTPEETRTDGNDGTGSTEAIPEMGETRAQLAAAQSRIETMLLREIQHQAEKRLTVASDLFDLGKHKLSDLLDGTGDIDSMKVTHAIDALLDSRPELAVRARPWGDVGGGRYNDEDEDTPDWTTALRGNN
ncbi:hypothetical protein ACFC1B_27590 [Streptomyces xiamenensis]|uniref:hypothetical protein n=1 Tax=Streptomyces xiamenensis TaxID=408015 RepID=UPI0035DF25FA